MKRLTCGALTLVCAAAISCGKDKTPVAPTPPPAATVLTGSVSVTGGSRISGATVKIIDGTNAGRTATTDTNGVYTIENLTPSNGNITANATIYDEVVKGLFINGPTTADFTFAIPACQTNNTASISFGNRSASTVHRIVWDGLTYTSVAPGQTSAPLTAAAGVAHALSFLIGNTSVLACSNASPVLIQCERGRVITCSFP